MPFMAHSEVSGVGGAGAIIQIVFETVDFEGITHTLTIVLLFVAETG